MHRYRLWVRISQTQTTNTFVTADDDQAAKKLGEAMFGKGSVLNYTRVS